MDVLVDFFEKAAPQDQRILKAMVERAGGPNEALKEPQVVQELLRREQTLDRAGSLPNSDDAVQMGSPLAYVGRTRHGAPGRSVYGGIEYSRAAESRRASVWTATGQGDAVAYEFHHPHSHTATAYAMPAGVDGDILGMVFRSLCLVPRLIRNVRCHSGSSF